MKRFTETEKWNDPWFRRLAPEHKLFWDYLCGNCDNAGVWKADFDMASFQMNCAVDPDKFLEKVNDGKERVKVLEPGKYWLVTGFYDFQFGRSRNNSILRNILKTINGHKFRDFIIQYIPSLKGGIREGSPSTGKGKGKGIREGKEEEGDIKGDEIFLEKLKQNKAYRGIDIDRELAKMDAWFLTHPGRQKTRRFIVNWLNKAERPIHTAPRKKDPADRELDEIEMEIAKEKGRKYGR